MELGNIIFEKELVNHKPRGYINYYSGAREYSEIDNDLPTLYVGWSFIRDNKLINESINILKQTIVRNKLYWEFSFDENKSSHVQGVSSFVNNVPYLYFNKKYKYINFDPVYYQIKNREDFFDIFPKEVQHYYQYKNRMAYILDRNNKIWGIDIEMYEFFKFNIRGILSTIKNGCEKVIIDYDGEKYIEQHKKFSQFTHLKRYLVVILSK